MNNASIHLLEKLKDFSSYSSISSVNAPPPSSQGRINIAISQLREASKKFATLSLEKRIALAESMQQGYLDIAERSIAASCKAKGIVPGSPEEGEEWSTGPWGIVRQLRLVCESLRALQKQGNTPIGTVNRNAAGNLSVNVYPNHAIDNILFKNHSVEVHMLPHVTEETLEAERASFYKNPQHQGKVALVLGAGNIAAIGAMDVITKMFNEGKVCLLKMNPVNAYLGPFIEEAFKEAIANHYLAVIYGGADVGRHLVYHPDIDEVHLTGSDKTHDQIVWGAPGTEQDERRSRNEPLLKKPITSELGNISPVIVVPGPYSTKEIAFQSEAIASAMTMNASFFCNSAKMLVLPAGWDGSAKFREGIRAVCAEVEPRLAYYPGAEDRWQALTRNRANITMIGKPGKGALPWTFISGLDAESNSEVLFHEEPFCSVLSEVEVGSADPVQFLQKAVEFCNTKLWGTLNVTLVVHPKTLKDARINAAFEKAICDLKYGTVAINTFPGLSFVFASAPWGAHPGSSLQNIQSGTGFVHNTSMLEGIEKAVLRAPLVVNPKPAFLPTHRTAQKVMRKITEMEQNASWAKVPGIIWAAMQG